ncbi:unnamed protein product [Protopolystoma xenopodis]|uniref:Uncharacterized protein n=1 Tax=Protopolystoma xenopodis TaxID=117903 RepID=A0A448WWB7_9PLAT|nr:unnamed protein product [Protopolystoma xenopodis]
MLVCNSCGISSSHPLVPAPGAHLIGPNCPFLLVSVFVCPKVAQECITSNGLNAVQVVLPYSPSASANFCRLCHSAVFPELFDHFRDQLRSSQEGHSSPHAVHGQAANRAFGSDQVGSS